jgi:uncharacterized protein (TIGR02246 family)
VNQTKGLQMCEDDQAIRDAQAAWLDATANGDLPRLLTLMAEDVVFLAPGPNSFWRETFAASFTAGLQQVRISCSGELEEVVVAGDVAYTRGRLSISVTRFRVVKPKCLAGYTLSVFRRRADGNWVLAREANLMSSVSA